MESNWNQLIDRYVSGELSAEGKAAFEQMCAANPELEASLQAHLLVVEGLKRAAQRNLVHEIGKTYHRIVRMKWIAGIALVVLITSGIVYWLMKKTDTVPVNTEQTDTFPAQTTMEEPTSDEPGTFVVEVNDSTGVAEHAISGRAVEETVTGIPAPAKRSNTHSQMNSGTSNDPAIKVSDINHAKGQNVEQLYSPGEKVLSDTEKKVLPTNSDGVSKNARIVKKYPMMGANDRYQLFFVDGKYGMLDSTGTVLFEPVYDSIVIFDFNYINLVKAVRVERIFFRVKSLHYNYRYYIKVLQANKWFLYTSDIRLITPDGFDELTEMGSSEGLLKVRNKELYGLIDYSGNMVLPIEYDDIYENHGLKARQGDRIYKLKPQKMQN